MQSQSLKSSSVKSGVIISVINAVILGVLGYSIRITLARNLTIGDYGFIYATLAFFAIFGAVFDLGISSSGMILMAKERGTKNFEKTYASFFISRTAVALLFLITVLPLAGFLSLTYFGKPSGTHCIVFFTLWLSLSIVAGGNLVTLDVLHDHFKRNFFQTLSLLITFILLISYYKITPKNTALAYAIGAIVTTLFLSMYMKKHHKLSLSTSWNEYKENLKKILHLSKWIAISTAGLVIMHNIDSLMLIKIRGLNDVGLYNGALPIVQIPIILIVFIPKVLIPKIASEIDKKPIKELIGMIYSFQRLILIPSILGLLVGYFIIDDIIVLLFKEKFATASTAAFILCCGVPLHAMSLISLGFLQSYRKERLTAIVVAISIIINVICNLLLIPEFGINGAATATLITYVIIYIALYSIVASIARKS